MKKIFTTLLLFVAAFSFSQDGTYTNLRVRNVLKVPYWIIYQGDTLSVVSVLPPDSLIVTKGYEVDTLILGGSNWIKTGNDIENANDGKVIITHILEVDSSAYFKDLYVDGDATAMANYYQYKKPQCLVTFMLDDGFQDDTTIINMFTTQGEIGSLGVATDWVDSLVSGFQGMTWAQLQAYQAAGWEIVSHSKTHVDLRTLTESQLKYEFETALDSFAAHNIAIENLVYPSHNNNQLVREVASKYHRAARGNTVQAKNDIVPKTFQLKSKQMNIGPSPYIVDVEGYKDTVDAALADNRWLIFYMHSYEGTPQRTADSVSKVIDYIQSLNIPIVTMNQALDSIGNMITIGDNFHANERGARLDTIWENIHFNGTKVSVAKYLTFPATSSSTTGVIYKSTTPFLHNYKPAANTGNNTFLGLNAGNFTMSSATAGQSSFNIGIGDAALTALTTGYSNSAVGYNALSSNNTGAGNVAIGYNAMALNSSGVANVAIGYNALDANIEAIQCVAIGFNSLTNSTSSANVGLGYHTLYTLTTGRGNTALGNEAGKLNSLGNYNTFIGYRTGWNETGSKKLYIGCDSTSLARAVSADGLLIYGDFDNNYLNFFKRVAIGAVVNPTYALEVTGSISNTSDLKVGDEIFATGLDSARSSYIAYYNKATGEITYDSLLTSGTSYADNMGNCSATQDVDMNDFNIEAADTLNAENVNITATGTFTMSGITIDTIATTLNADNKSIPTCKAVSDAITGYTLGASRDATSILDNVTIYWGSHPSYGTNGTTRALRRIYIPKSGHVKAIYLCFLVGNIGSSETSSVYFDYDATTTTLIDGLVTFDATTTIAHNDELDIEVTAGHFFELSIVTPLDFVVNPDYVYMNAQIYIE